MSSRLEIKYINKTNRTDPHTRIKNVGGINNLGQRWKYSVDEAIKIIEAGICQFWTKGGGKSVNVVIASHNGHKYLKTEADGVHPNNLLSLPECE
jgi:hypothetical protein